MAEAKNPGIEIIELERKTPDFDTRFEDLKQRERLELVEYSRSHEIKDKYKAKYRQYLLEQGINVEKGTELPPEMRECLDLEISTLEAEYSREGICFLYCQFHKIIEGLKRGEVAEVEAFGPYLRDYLDYVFEKDTMGVKFTKADEIGLAILKFLLTEVIPEAHLVSLYDEYNLWTTASNVLGKPLDRSEFKSKEDKDMQGQKVEFDYERGRLENESETLKKAFRDFIERVLKQRGLIKEGEVDGPENDYSLLSESSKVEDAIKLAKMLKAQGNLEGEIDDEKSELFFVISVDNCEDPRYMKFRLRDGEGHWECAALDASGYIADSNGQRVEKFRNENINHLICLDKNIFLEQQNQVWEIIHSLKKDGKALFSGLKVHNIFFDSNNPDVTPESVIATFREYLGFSS